MSEQPLKEKMSTDVLIVHLADSMQEIYPQISEQPDRFVVILDDEDVPLYITTGAEMKRKMPRSLDWPAVGDFAARLPEALLVDEHVTVEQAMVFFNAMSVGLVVMRESEVVGVLPHEVLNAYYNAEVVPALRADTKTVRSDGAVTVAHAVFRCRRYPRCSHQQTVSQVDGPVLCKIPAHGRMVLLG